MRKINFDMNRDDNHPYFLLKKCDYYQYMKKQKD